MDTNLPPSQALDPYAHGLAAGVDSIYTPFLGPPPRVDKTSAYQKRNVDKWNMPDAYVGENLFVRDTMEDWMFTANQTWYTERIMPWRVTDQINLQWTETEANAFFTGITPYQATSRLVTQRRTIRHASLIRRGIAAEFEHDFVKTSMGRSSFFASLGQMARSVQETANAEVIRSLLHSHQYQQEYVRKHGIVKDLDLDGWLERDRDRFMTAQKDKNGLEKLDMVVNKELYVYGGSANAWIVPEELSIYTTIVPPNKTDYWLAGQGGPNRVENAGARAVAQAGTMGNMDRIEPVHWIRTTPVYVARSFHVDTVGQEDLLTRVRQIGGYNTMFDENTNFADYKSASRDISIYNEDIDNFSKISFADAIRNCGLWDENGDLMHPGRGGPRDRMDRDAINRDLDRDFLTYAKSDGARHNAVFLGDVAEEFFNLQDIENAGETVFQALVRSRPDLKDVIGKFESAIGNVRQLLTENGAPFDLSSTNGTLTGLAGITDVQMASLAQALDSLLGGTNLFNQAGMDQSVLDRLSAQKPINSSITNNFYRTFLTHGAVPIVRDSAQPTQLGSSVDASKIGQGFLQAIKSKISASEHREADVIINDTSASIEERSLRLKDLMNRCCDDKVDGFEFSNKSSITRFYNKGLKNYNDLLAKSAPIVGSQVSSGSTSPERRLAYPGRSNLPAGWRYENPTHANTRMDAIHPVPSKLEHIHVFNAASQQQQGQRSSEPQRRGGARTMGGTGLSSIGRFNFGENDEVLRRQQKRRNRDPTEFENVSYRFRNLAHLMKKLAEGAARPIVKICSLLYLGARINRDVFLAFYRHNIVVPFGVLLFRPHATYRTRYAIKCQDMGGCGNTYFGHSDMQIQHDAARKIALAHYTYHTAAVVTNSKNVHVAPDVYCERYLGGYGIDWWTPQLYKNKNLDYTARSLIAVVIPYRERQIDVKIDIAGRWYTHQRMGLVRQSKFEELLYSTAFRYNQLYRFYDPLGRGRAMDEPNFAPGSIGVNRVCWQAMQFNYNPVSNAFDKVRINQGHMGPRVYAGCGQVRNGKLKYLKDPNYEKFATN